MESLLLSVNAVVPFFIYIAFGYLVRTVGLASEAFLNKLNQLIFKAFFPIMMFCNLYTIDPGEVFRGRFVVVEVCSVLAVTGLGLLIVPRLVKENARRGVIIQALYRSNAVLFMLPLTVSIYGQDCQGTVTLALAFLIPLYNVIAVVVLESFRGGKVEPKVFVENIVKNPMIDGAAAGLLFYALGIDLPSCVLTPLQQYSSLCTPLGMFVLGGTLKFSQLKSDMRYVVPTLAAKLVLIPALTYSVGLALGLEPVERFLLLAMYATPVAAASYPMAQNMGGDGDLAGELVVMSTALSVVTLFLWILALSTLSLI